jgi:hypothetical protein
MKNKRLFLKNRKIKFLNYIKINETVEVKTKKIKIS